MAPNYHVPRLPREVIDIINRMSGAADLLKKAFGVLTWVPARADDSVGITNQVLIATQQRQIEELTAKFDEVSAKYEAAMAADAKWKVFARNRDRITFISSAGKMASLPVTLAEAKLKGLTLDADISEAGGMVKFVRKGVVIADIPSTLALTLTEVLRRDVR